MLKENSEIENYLVKKRDSKIIEQRQEDFKKLGLGLFIHYGLYSKFGKGEWYWKMYHLTEQEYYSQVGKNFVLKADFFKVARWASQNDFRYLVLTAKHHDGFALYDSQGLSQYDIHWLNQQKDLIKEYVEACYAFNLKPFIYYATMEWTQTEESFDQHLNNIYQNIELLLKTYGQKIGGFWFDGNWSEPNQDWKLDELYQMIRNYHPTAIIVNNTGLENKGVVVHPEIDSVTYEQGMVITEKEVSVLPFEAVLPINDHWGTTKFDFNFKSLPQLIKDFIEIRSMGGNLLLNIGLNKNGEIGFLEKAIIEKFHDWNQITNYWWTDSCQNVINHSDYWKYNDYIILKNVHSGAHLENIHYGNQEGKILKVPLKIDEKEIEKLFYLDTQENIEFWIEKESFLCFRVKSFEYGYNTIYRFLKIEMRNKNV